MRYFHLSFLFLVLFSCFSFAQETGFDHIQLKYDAAIYFDFGKYNVDKQADSTLQVVKMICDSIENYIISIDAHTDSIGSIENNQRLSENRASSVKQALAQIGISDTAIVQIRYHGELKPKTENASKEGRQQNRRANILVYEAIEMTVLTGQIKDKKTGEGIPANVVLHTKTEKDTFPTLPNGEFKRLVPSDVVMGIDVYSKNYFYETKMFKTKKGKTPPLTIEVTEAKKGDAVAIKDLFFYGSQAVLLPISEPQLPKVLRFMEINPDLKIEIGGHVNFPNRPPVTEESWEYDLSVRRAKLVYEYLLENGISEGRVQFKGYGNYEMRYPKATTEKQQSLNRRVEIKVVE